VPAAQGKHFSDSGAKSMPRRSEPICSSMPPHRAATPQAVRRGITQAHTAGTLLAMCVHACGARWPACKRVCASVRAGARTRMRRLSVRGVRSMPRAIIRKIGLLAELGIEVLQQPDLMHRLGVAQLRLPERRRTC
jgi:hypothetical protein